MRQKARAVLHAMWSDPSDSDAGMRAGVHLGQRGGSIPEFGPDITKRFCERNGVEVVIRSHQFVKEGFKLMHSGHLLTVFSARDYFVDTGDCREILPCLSPFLSPTMVVESR